MSRRFVSGSSQYLEYAGAVETEEPVTLASWVFKPTGSSENAVFMALGSAVDDDAIRLQITALFDVRAATVANSLVSYSSPGTLSVDVWHHIGGVYASNASRIGYLDGVPGAEQTTNRNANDLDTTNIGCEMFNGARDQYVTASMAEACIWNEALNPMEMWELWMGKPPWKIRPWALRGFWLPFGDRTDRDFSYGGRGVYHMTAGNSPTWADAPPQILRRYLPNRKFGYQNDFGETWFQQLANVPAAPTTQVILTPLAAYSVPVG